jgi:hypothetical protein
VDLRDVVAQALCRDYPETEVLAVDAIIDGYEVVVALKGGPEAPEARTAIQAKAEWAVRTSRMIQGDYTVDFVWR